MQFCNSSFHTKKTLGVEVNITQPPPRLFFIRNRIKEPETVAKLSSFFGYSYEKDSSFFFFVNVNVMSIGKLGYLMFCLFEN